MSYRRVVVKIGSSTLTHATGQLNIRRMEHLVKVLSDIKNSGVELVIVSSGAVAIGCGKLGFGGRPEDIETKQALAAIGQCELMYLYDKLFAEYNHTVAQVLLTNEDVVDGGRRKNIENTMFRLIELGSIPVINENDTVSVKEIEVGIFNENDGLSAVVSNLVRADLLIIVSDIDGLYDSDPRTNNGAELLRVVNDITAVKSCAGGSVSAVGTGGMATKINAAEMVTKNGTDMVILNGENPGNLYLAVEKQTVGTLFPAAKDGRL